jgi:hypothetical protein
MLIPSGKEPDSSLARATPFEPRYCLIQYSYSEFGRGTGPNGFDGEAGS